MAAMRPVALKFFRSHTYWSAPRPLRRTPAAVKAATDVADDDMILDIGPETAALATQLKSAGTIVWNGPVGVFEFAAFEKRHQRSDRPGDCREQRLQHCWWWRHLAAIAKYGIERNRATLGCGGGAFLEERWKARRCLRSEIPQNAAAWGCYKNASTTNRLCRGLGAYMLDRPCARPARDQARKAIRTTRCRLTLASPLSRPRLTRSISLHTWLRPVSLGVHGPDRHVRRQPEGVSPGMIWVNLHWRSLPTCGKRVLLHGDTKTLQCGKGGIMAVRTQYHHEFSPPNRYTRS